MSIVTDEQKQLQVPNEKAPQNNLVKFVMERPSSVEHPASNTDAENTTIPGFDLDILIDWCEGTLPDELTLDEMAELFGLQFTDFVEVPCGKHGYKTQHRFQNDVIFLSDGAKNMGKHFILTGTGCRIVEQKMNGDWVGFFEVLMALFCHFSRVDVAIDDFRNRISIDTVRRKIRSGECVSQFRKVGEMVEYDLEATREMRVRIDDKREENLPLTEEEEDFLMYMEGVHTGQTFYFGSAKSRIRFRLYDKLAQMSGKLEMIKRRLERQKDEPDQHDLENYNALFDRLSDITSWVRFEMQCRDARANELVGQFVAHIKSPAQIVTGVLLNYIRFADYNPNDRHNASRWPTSAWYADFLGYVEKNRLTSGVKIPTIERKRIWFEEYVSKTLAQIFLADIGRETFFHRMVKVGLEKMKESDFEIIDPKYMESYQQMEREKFEAWYAEYQERKEMGAAHLSAEEIQRDIIIETYKRRKEFLDQKRADRESKVLRSVS